MYSSARVCRLHHHAVDSLPGRRALGGQREGQASACCQRVVEERGDEGGVAWTLRAGNHVRRQLQC